MSDAQATSPATETKPLTNGAAGVQQPIGTQPLATAPPLTGAAATSPEDAARFAALTKQATAVAKKAQEVKAKEDAVAAREAKVAELEKLKAQAKLRPLEVLKAVGLSFEDVQQSTLANGRTSPELAVAVAKEEVAQLRAEMKAQEAKRLEADSQRVYSDFRAGVANHVKSNASEFKLINAWGEHESVIRHIEEDYLRQIQERDTDDSKPAPVPLTAKAAAEAVEKKLKERYETAKKLEAPASTPNIAGPRNETPQRRTLSNAITASTTSALPPPVNDQERLQRARAAMDAVRATKA